MVSARAAAQDRFSAQSEQRAMPSEADALGELAGSDAMLHFQSARVALMAYLKATEELRWRVRHLLNKSDRVTQAVERLVNAGIGNFRYCADACAYLYAREHEGCAFPGGRVLWTQLGKWFARRSVG